MNWSAPSVDASLCYIKLVNASYGNYTQTGDKEMLKTYATKLEDNQVKALKKLSAETKIPQAELVRQAIDLFLEKFKADRERLEFLKRLDARLDEDKEALKRLAKL